MKNLLAVLCTLALTFGVSTLAMRACVSWTLLQDDRTAPRG